MGTENQGDVVAVECMKSSVLSLARQTLIHDVILEKKQS